MRLTGSLVEVGTGNDLHRHTASPGKECETSNSPPIHAKFVGTTSQSKEEQEEAELQQVERGPSEYQCNIA